MKGLMSYSNDPFMDLAKVGYDAYGAKAEWKAYNGQPMPQWDELPQHIRDKWRSAAKAMKLYVDDHPWPEIPDSSPRSSAG